MPWPRPGPVGGTLKFRPETSPSPNQSPDYTVGIHSSLLGAWSGWELFHAEAVTGAGRGGAGGWGRNPAGVTGRCCRSGPAS